MVHSLLPVMLLLAMSCLRADAHDADVTGAVLQGALHHGLRLGLARLDRCGTGGDSARRAVLGQVLGQALLAVGHAAQAEELFQKQLRSYEALPRSQARWRTSMDRGHLSLSLNKPGRAAQSFNVVADDAEAPLALRLEALMGLASALQGVGEQRRAARTLAHASQLAGQDSAVRRLLLEAAGLELDVLCALRHFDEPTPGAGHTDRISGYVRPLRRLSDGLSNMPLVCHRLRFLAALVDPELGSLRGSVQLLDELRWWKEQRLDPVEEVSRIEAALALLDRGKARLAAEILGPLASDVADQQHHRHVIELKYFASRFQSLQGRHAEALRSFQQHASRVQVRLRTELLLMPYSRFLERRDQVDHTDSDQLLLPLRYRRAYEFIQEHLSEKELSIRRVAAHIGVSERALQNAFRTHLGLTPAAVIRQLRVASIRAEIQQLSGRDGVLDVAKRWGMSSRSTLVKNYRKQFGETPTSTPDGASRTSE